MGRYTLVWGTLLLAVFVVPLISALAGGPTLGMERVSDDSDGTRVVPPDSDPDVPVGSLDFVDSSVSGPPLVGTDGRSVDIGKLCLPYAIGVDWQEILDTLNRGGQVPPKVGANFDFTLKQVAYMRCLMDYNTTFTRVFAGYTISYIYFHAGFSVFVGERIPDDDPRLGYGRTVGEVVGYASERMFWLKDAQGCIVSAEPKSWANRDVASSCSYPAIPAGFGPWPIPVTKEMFWALVIRDMYGVQRLSKEGWQDYYENGGDFGGLRVMYTEYTKFGYKYTVEKVRASCGGLLLWNSKPLGCEYIRQHYRTDFQSFSNPPETSAEALSSWVWDPQATTLYTYPTDMAGTSVTYHIQEARGAACIQQCSQVGKYGDCLEKVDYGCQPTWSPPGTVYDDDFTGYWNPLDPTPTRYNTGVTVTRIHVNKWHYVYCESGWNWIEYGHLCPVGESSPGILYTSMTDSEWSLISSYLAELAAADRKADMALFMFYTNQWNGYMTQERLDMFKQYIATGDANAFAGATCKYCPKEFGEGDPANYGWTGTYSRLVDQWGVHGNPTGAWTIEPNHYDRGGSGETDHLIWTNQPSLCQMMQWKTGTFYCYTTGANWSGVSWSKILPYALCSMDRFECYNPVPPGIMLKSEISHATNVQRGNPGAISKFYDAKTGKEVPLSECSTNGCEVRFTGFTDKGTRTEVEIPGSRTRVCTARCSNAEQLSGKSEWGYKPVTRVTYGEEYSLINRVFGVTIFDFGGEYCGVTTTEPLKFVCIAPTSGYPVPIGRQDALISIGPSGWLFIDDLWFVYLGCVTILLLFVAIKRRRGSGGSRWQSAVKHT